MRFVPWAFELKVCDLDTGSRISIDFTAEALGCIHEIERSL